MHTEKLFYEDPHLSDFDAQVLSCRRGDAGWSVVTDRTAFYPGGGGQVCDIGTLGTAQVTQVWEENGALVHLCDAPLSPGQTVRGQIDRARRFDLMQQHTGEHIVSGIVFRRYGFHNTGFHVGTDGMEVDFDGEIPQADIPLIEQQANEYVWENLPVECTFPSESELAQTPYRSKKPLSPPIRLVRIPGVDCCACCGIHTAATGEVGMIHIASCTRLRGGVRLVMRCGSRAVRYLRQVFEQGRLVSQAFSAQMSELGEAAQKMNELVSAQKQSIAQLHTQLFSLLARQFAGQGDILYFTSGLSGAQLRELACLIAAQCGGRAAVFSGENGAYLYCLSDPTNDLRALCAQMNRALNGRGGGKPACCQGNVTADEDRICDFFRDFPQR